ncbi:MAG: hypothetical protein K6T26_08800 [Alicyclobacillus sp.]|nr:hypothetical protein [Alicyclobacillus sp.]
MDLDREGALFNVKSPSSGKSKASAVGRAALALGLGLLAGPAVAGWAGTLPVVWAQTVNVHENTQVHEQSQVHSSDPAHVNVHVHDNVIVHDNSNAHANVQVHDNSDVHANVQVHDNSDAHANVQVHDNSNAHANVQVHNNSNVHVNAQDNTQGRVTVQAASQADAESATASAQVNVQIAVQALQTALRQLGCDRTDLVSVYLQSVSWSAADMQHIQANVQQLQHLVAQVHSKGRVDTADRLEAWHCMLQTLTSLHVHVVGLQAQNQVVDVQTPPVVAGVRLQLQDDQGRILCSLPAPDSSASITPLLTTAQAAQSAAQAAQELASQHTVVSDTTLPHTATHDPLGIAAGGLLLSAGLAAGVPAMIALRRRRQS